MSNNAVVTRFAPSPTGELHLGNARTALFNFLLAGRQGGRFLLRVEDTDAARSSDAYIQALQDDLTWLGLRWDLGPGVNGATSEWRQSERGAIYESFYARLQASGQAYPCFCTALELDLARRAQLAAGRPPRYAGTCRDLSDAQRAERAGRGLRAALRFAVAPGNSVEFQDLVHGSQSVRTEEIGDFIIRREDGTAAFFFCNAIDDALMQVTQVLRGEDHLSNTPRQLLLLTALGLPAPQYGHVSLLTGQDGAPLSKRHGATTVRELREQGYSAVAINNLIFRLGHSTRDNALLSMNAMNAAFDVTHLQRASAHFDATQLRHWQNEWVRSLSPSDAAQWLRPWLPGELAGASLTAFLTAVMPNVSLAEDVREWVSVILVDALEIAPEARAAIDSAGPAFFASAAARVRVLIPPAGTTVDGVALLAALREATGSKGAAFFKPLRAALTGRLHGPELAPLLVAMPGERVCARLAVHAGH
jgi:glutamyl-tRNA synthetase